MHPALSTTQSVSAIAAAHGLGPSIEDRLEQLESFDAKLSQAINEIVTTVLDLREQQASAAELTALAGKVRELEQQLALERSIHDLARVSRMHPKTRTVVCVGTTYFGDNAKYAWAALNRHAVEVGLDLWFLPFNAEQETLVHALGGRCLPAGHVHWTAQHLQIALSTAVVVTSDHFLNPNPFAAALLAGARHVQLWHGVSIKEIGLRNVGSGRALGPHLARVLATCGPYHRFVGTAARAEPEWRRWFAFDRYSPIGYPRNDVLFREPDEMDLAGIDRATWERAVATLARGKRVLLYAPTFRDGRPAWLQLEWIDRMARAAAQRGDLFILNLHPVEQPQVPKLAEVLPDVCFVAPRTDVYPLLALASALITDYSSVMFDFLHLDRPVLWFRPDHESYTTKSRQLFDDKLPALPGPVFSDAEAVARALKRDDLAQTAAHARLRRELRTLWFDHHDGDSGARFAALVAEELALAGVAESIAEAG